MVGGREGKGGGILVQAGRQDPLKGLQGFSFPDIRSQRDQVAMQIEEKDLMPVPKKNLTSFEWNASSRLREEHPISRLLALKHSLRYNFDAETYSVQNTM